MAVQDERLDFIDLLKFVLSVAVVAIHVNPFGPWGSWANPILRTAVPLFFLITAYFFFSGYASCGTLEERFLKLEKYVKRNMQLYLFWLVLLFVPSSEYYGWFRGGVVQGLYLMSHCFIHGSLFSASWFIMASVIAVVVIAAESRYLQNWQLVVLAVIPYIACCLLSNYVNYPYIAARRDALRLLFDGGCTSFWAALLWFALAKWLADRREFVAQASSSVLVCAALIGLVAVCVENYLVVARGWCQERSDCYFSLPLLCVPLFLLALRVRLKVPCVRELRVMSTVTYCLHSTLMFILRNWLGVSLGPRRFFVLVLAICWAVSLAIMRLEKLPHLRWLRFSH